MTRRIACAALTALALLAFAAPAALAQVRNATNYQSIERPFTADFYSRYYDEQTLSGNPFPREGARFSGAAWQQASDVADPLAADGFKGDYAFIDPADQTGNEWVTWTPKIYHAGRYEVWVSFTSGADRATDARYIVTHAEGTQEYRVNQTLGNQTPGKTRTWCKLGTWPFRSSAKYGNVKQVMRAAAGVKVADAVGFRLVSKLGPYEVTGTLTLHGDPVDNAVVRSEDLSIVPYRTGADGKYKLLVPYMWSGPVRPSKEYYDFHPVGGTSNLYKIKADTVLNFTSDYNPPPPTE